MCLGSAPATLHRASLRFYRAHVTNYQRNTLQYLRHSASLFVAADLFQPTSSTLSMVLRVTAAVGHFTAPPPAVCRLPCYHRSDGDIAHRLSPQARRRTDSRHVVGRVDSVCCLEDRGGSISICHYWASFHKTFAVTDGSR